GSGVETTFVFALRVSATLVGTTPKTLASLVNVGSLVTSTKVSSMNPPFVAEKASTIIALAPSPSSGTPPGPLIGKYQAPICSGNAPTVCVSAVGGCTSPLTPSVTLQKSSLASPPPPPKVSGSCGKKAGVILPGLGTSAPAAGARSSNAPVFLG